MMVLWTLQIDEASWSECNRLLDQIIHYVKLQKQGRNYTIINQLPFLFLASNSEEKLLFLKLQL